MKEIWKDVAGFEGRYQVSSRGRVKSLSRKVRCRNGVKNSPGKILTPGFTGHYYFVVLCKFGKKSYRQVHRLVAEAFIPNPEAKPEVNHKDLVKVNNFATNLEWVTKSEQAIHAVSHGACPDNRGSRNGQAKLDEDKVRSIKAKHKQGRSIRSLAKEFKVTTAPISHIVNGKSWKHVK